MTNLRGGYSDTPTLPAPVDISALSAVKSAVVIVDCFAPTMLLTLLVSRYRLYFTKPAAELAELSSAVLTQSN